MDSYFYRETVDTSLVDTLGATSADARGSPSATSGDRRAAGAGGFGGPADDGEERDRAAGATKRPGQRALLRLSKKPNAEAAASFAARGVLIGGSSADGPGGV